MASGATARRWGPGWGLLAGLGAAHLLAAAWRLGRLWRFPYNVDGNESYLLTYLRQAAEGSWYGPIDRAPFLMTHYPPLGLWVLRWTVGWAPLLRQIPVGRVQTFAAALVMAAAFAAALRRSLPAERRGPRWAYLAAAVSTLHFHVYAPVFLLDPFALAATWLGLAALLGERRGGWALAAACFVIAYNLKQTQLAAPAAALAWLWGRHHPSRRPFALAMAAGLAITVAVQHATGWVPESRVHGPGSLLLSERYQPFHFQLGLFLVACLAAAYPWVVAAAVRSWRLGASEAAGLWRWYAAAAALSAAPMLIHPGANHNLFTEGVYAGLALAISGTAHLAGRERRIWIAAGLIQMALTLRWPGHERLPFVMDTPDAAVLDARRALHRRLAAVEGPLLCYGDYDWCLLNGRMPPINLTPLPLFVAAGWDPDPLRRAIVREDFSAAVLQLPPEEDALARHLLTPDLLAAFRRHYLPERSYAEDWLYRPRGRPDRTGGDP